MSANLPVLHDATPAKISAVVGGVAALIAVLAFIRKIIK